MAVVVTRAAAKPSRAKCQRLAYPTPFGTRKAEVLNSLKMKITANENDTNDILQTFQ